MKLWNIGVRIFKGLGKCRVYHFSSVSLRKKAWNNGAKTFLLKWGISIKFFKKHYLKSGLIYNGPLTDPKKNLNFFPGPEIYRLPAARPPVPAWPGLSFFIFSYSP